MWKHPVFVLGIALLLGSVCRGQEGFVSPSFSLDGLETDLTTLSKQVYGYKRDFFLGLAKTVTSLRVGAGLTPAVAYRSYQARYFALELVAPVLEDTPSQVIQRLLPTYRTTLASLREQLGIESLSEIEATPLVLGTALNAAWYAVHASTRFFPREKDQAAFDRLGQDLVALSTGLTKDNTTTRESITSRLKRAQEIIGLLLEHHRTRGFGALLVKIRGYCEES